MIYSIVGTDLKGREKAFKEIAKLGNITEEVHSESAYRLLSLVESKSIFGEKIIVSINQTLENSSSKEIVSELFSEMKKSENIFIMDEPFIDANRLKTLVKFSEKVFDERVEKKETIGVFIIANLLEKRDKKGLWKEWFEMKDKEEGESLQGILWWKWASIWRDTVSGKKTAYSIKECEDIGKKILLSSILSHRGEADIKIELEKVILSI